MDEAEALCDRVAILDHGRILELDTPTALVRGLGAAVRISVDRHALDPADASRIAGVDGVDTEDTSTVVHTRRPEPVIAALAEHGALSGLQVKGATLEDVFLSLTGREYRA
jgi:ABC-2 type transport system ATP-binding protein